MRKVCWIMTYGYCTIHIICISVFSEESVRSKSDEKEKSSLGGDVLKINGIIRTKKSIAYIYYY